MSNKKDAKFKYLISIPALIFTIPIFLVSLFFGLVTIFPAADQMRLGYQSRSWLRATGIISQSEIVIDIKSHIQVAYKASIEYT